jgi:DNA-binding CsgD family transcriptional regulator
MRSSGSWRRVRDAAEWRARAEKLLAGLGAEIDRPFDRWSLTPAEREVALLVLKGLSHKEAAALLGRSERTVRQHAAAVDRKSDLAGRAELAAFFLEDLLLPPAGGNAERLRAQA